MSYLGEVFPLGNFHSGVISSSPCSSPHRVLVTIQGNGSHIYNSVDQKCLRSWSVKPTFKFSHAAFQHHKSHIFFAVRDKKKVYSWNEQQEMEKGYTKDFSEEISQILPCSVDESIIIVFENKNISILNSQLKEITSFNAVAQKFPSAKILWCHSQKRKNESRTFLLIKNNEEYQLLSFIWDPSDHTVDLLEFFTLKSPSKSIFPISCAFEDVSGVVHVIWSNVTWQVYEVPVVGQTNDKTELSPKIQIPIGCYDNPLLGLIKDKQNVEGAFGRCGFDCVVIQPSYIAMVGPHKGSYLITIWDSKYGTVHSTQSFEKSSQEPSEISANIEIKMRCSLNWGNSNGGQLIITDLSSVWICQFECPQVSLLEVIGRMKETSKLLQKSDAQNLVHPPISSVLKPSGGNVKQNEEKEEKEAISQLTSPKSTPTIEAFTSTFMNFVKREGRKSNAILSHNFIKATISRCVSEKNFFAEEVLEYLIKTMSISSLEENLLTSILQRKNLKLLGCFLLNVHDITEPQLAQILKFILSEVDNNCLSEFVENMKKSAGSDILFSNDVPRDYFLYLVVSAPRNDIFLESCVKSLSFQEVLSTLVFLKKMLERYMEREEKNLKKSIKTRIPTHAQVIDWVALMLDAHFSQLVLTKESHQLLRELQDIVLKKIEACERIESLKGQLEYFMYARKSVNSAIKTYSVEVLHI